MSDEKHTPTPWECSPSISEPGTFRIEALKHQRQNIARVHQIYIAYDDTGEEPDEITTEANARFIVQACNSHDKLVEQGQQLVDYLWAVFSKADHQTAIPPCFDRFRQALADAKK